MLCTSAGRWYQSLIYIGNDIYPRPIDEFMIKVETEGCSGGLHLSHTIFLLVSVCIVSDLMCWLAAIQNKKRKWPGQYVRELRFMLVCVWEGTERTVNLCRTECIFALQALSRQVGWEGFDESNLILDRKPNHYVKVENFSSKTSGAWGLGLVMDFLHLHFLKLFDFWPDLSKNSKIFCLAKISVVCMYVCSSLAVWLLVSKTQVPPGLCQCWTSIMVCHSPLGDRLGQE